MKVIAESHHLLILSQDFEAYQNLIDSAHLPGLSIHATDKIADALRIAGGCDLLFGEPAILSQVIDYIPQLKWVQATWAGVEPLIAHGMRRDYTLTNARNVYGSMMAEYVFGYLLSVERRILPRWQSQLAGKWDRRPSGRLKGKLIGLVGVGTIGAQLAKTARHFGMRVYGYTHRSEACTEVDRYFHGQDWPIFAADLDYLVCTLPGTAKTKNLVDAAHLSALPAKVWLVNIGRGTTVDESALVNALNIGAIAGAILDVFAEEPLPAGHPLWTTPNTFITAHTAARNYLPDIAGLFIENYQRFIQGVSLLYQVDFSQGY